MAFLPQRSPKKSQFILRKYCWEERCRWLLSLLLMSDAAHVCIRNQMDPSGSEQSPVLNSVSLLLVKPKSEAVFKPVSSSSPLSKQWNGSPSPEEETQYLPHSWPGSSWHLCTSPAAESPSSLFLSKNQCLGAQSQARSHTYGEKAQRVKKSAFKTTLDPQHAFTSNIAPALKWGGFHADKTVR